MLLLLIILLILIILAILEQLNVDKYISKNDGFIISLRFTSPELYINPYTGNYLIVCSENNKLNKEYKQLFSNKIKPKKLLLSQISKPIHNFIHELKKISPITPITDFCGLVEPILKTVIRPPFSESLYTVYTNDNLRCLIFNNKLCFFMK